jgi:hypothetical protein
MLSAFPEDAALFTADIELRRVLLAKRYRPPIPFITIMEFGLKMQVDQSPFPASPFECPSNSTGDIR